MTDYGGTLATPVDNLSDVDAVPAMREVDSAEWTQNQTTHVFRVPLGREVITVETSGADFPDWLRTAVADLNRIAGLKEGWDSYGARSVPQRTLQHALATLMRLVNRGVTVPLIHPTPAGGVAFGWHVMGRDLEVTIERPFVIHAYFRDDEQANHESEVPVSLNLEEIIDRVAQMSR